MEVVAEAEVVLGGGLPDWFRTGYDPIPGWAWLNELAHARMARLIDLAEGVAAPYASGWSGAVSFLAHEVLAAGGTAEGVLDLQRAALIPLELDILGCDDAIPATRGQLVGLVQALIEDYQRQRHRR